MFARVRVAIARPLAAAGGAVASIRGRTAELGVVVILANNLLSPAPIHVRKHDIVKDLPHVRDVEVG